MASPVRHCEHIVFQSTCWNHQHERTHQLYATWMLKRQGRRNKNVSNDYKQVWLRYVQTSLTKGSNSSLALKGTIRTLVGATRGGSDNTCRDDIKKTAIGYCQYGELTPRSTSCSLLQKLCSSKVYMIRPRPNEGSMTFGVNSRTV